MTLNESVAKLQTLLPSLNAGDAKFAASLIASYTKWNSLSPKQEPWIAKLIARAETPKFQVIASYPATVQVGGFEGVVALLAKAKESGLKFPKVRLKLDDTVLILSLNGAKSKFPGYVSISGEGKYPNKAFYGKVSPEGAFQPFKAELPGLTDLLSKLASNPARVAKDYGKLTGNCCFCGKVVGDGKEVRSVLAGFGPDCAENYGLKAEWLAAADKAEAAQAVSQPSTLLEVFTDDSDDTEPVLIAPEALEAVGTLHDDGTYADDPHCTCNTCMGAYADSVGEASPEVAVVWPQVRTRRF